MALYARALDAPGAVVGERRPHAVLGVELVHLARYRQCPGSSSRDPFKLSAWPSRQP